MVMKPYGCTYSTIGSLEYPILCCSDEALWEEKSVLTTSDAEEVEVASRRWLGDDK